MGRLLETGADSERKWPVVPVSTIAVVCGEGPVGVVTGLLDKLLVGLLSCSHFSGVPQS